MNGVIEKVCRYFSRRLVVVLTVILLQSIKFFVQFLCKSYMAQFGTMCNRCPTGGITGLQSTFVYQS